MFILRLGGETPMEDQGKIRVVMSYEDLIDLMTEEFIPLGGTEETDEEVRAKAKEIREAVEKRGTEMKLPEEVIGRLCKAVPWLYIMRKAYELDLDG